MIRRTLTFASALLMAVVLAGCGTRPVSSNVPHPAFLPFPEPSWLEQFQLFSYGSPDPEAMRKLGITATTWGIFFAGVDAQGRAYLERVHQAGFRTFSNFSTMQAYDWFDREPGIEERSACMSLNGRKSKMFWSAESPQPWIPCNHNPEWIGLLDRRMREHVRAGVDGVQIDEVEGIGGFLFAAGFCPYCMAAFREYLREHFPNPDDRRRRFGIADLDSFDYGAYLRGLGRTLQGDPNPALRREFVLFQIESRVRHIESLVTLAKRMGGPQVAVSANTSFLTPHKQVFMPALDLVTYEEYVGVPPLGRQLATALWARGTMNPKRSVEFPVSLDMAGLTSEDWPVVAFWMLEALSGGESFLIPYDAYTGFGRYTVPFDPLVPVGSYLRRYEERFHEARPLAEVAVLYDLATGLTEYLDGGFALPISPGTLDRSIRGLGRALQEGHIPYEVVCSGDGRFVDRTPALKELNRYRVIVIPSVPDLLPKTRERLEEYRRGGGSLVDMGDLGANYYDNLDPADRDEIVARVNANLIAPAIETDAGPKVGIVPWQSLGRLVVHFLNYDFDAGKHAFTPIGPVRVRIRLADGISPQAGRLTVGSPWDEAVSIPFELSGGSVSFTLPSLASYSLAVLE